MLTVNILTDVQNVVISRPLERQSSQQSTFLLMTVMSDGNEAGTLALA